MIKVHIKNTKHITIENIYIPPRGSTSTHYETVGTDILHCIQQLTKIPHSVLTGDVNAHSTFWHSYTDDQRGQLIADAISNSDHITLNTPIMKFITNYIKGHKADTTYRNHTSIQCHFKNGVSQGGFLSPTLFNIYTADFPPPRAPGQAMFYADDITITSTQVLPGQNITISQ